MDLSVCHSRFKWLECVRFFIIFICLLFILQAAFINLLREHEHALLFLLLLFFQCHHCRHLFSPFNIQSVSFTFYTSLLFYIVCGEGRRETDRQTNRQTQTDRPIETQRDTDRQRHRKTETQRQTNRQRETERQRHRQTDKQRDRDTDRQRHTERDREGERERERDRERETETQTDRQADRDTESGLFYLSFSSPDCMRYWGDSNRKLISGQLCSQSFRIQIHRITVSCQIMLVFRLVCCHRLSC